MAINIFGAAVVLSTALFLVVAFPHPQDPAPQPPPPSNQGAQASNFSIDCKTFQQQCTSQNNPMNTSMPTPPPGMANEQVPSNQSALCNNQQAQLMCTQMVSNPITTNMNNITQIQNINTMPTLAPMQVPSMPTMPMGKKK